MRIRDQQLLNGLDERVKSLENQPNPDSEVVLSMLASLVGIVKRMDEELEALKVEKADA